MRLYYSKRNKYITYSVIPTCSESFLKKDSRQAGVTKKERFPTSGNDNTKGYVNLFDAFVLDGRTNSKTPQIFNLC